MFAWKRVRISLIFLWMDVSSIHLQVPDEQHFIFIKKIPGLGYSLAVPPPMEEINRLDTCSRSLPLIKGEDRRGLEFIFNWKYSNPPLTPPLIRGENRMNDSNPRIR